MMQDKERLIKSAVDKSEKALASAEFNFKNHDYDTCLNRLYYSIFILLQR